MCKTEPDFSCPECGTSLKNTYHCPECDADVRELDSGVDREEQFRERLSGEGPIHRLRDWTDGDTLYGVMTINTDTGATFGKTYQQDGEAGDDAESRARDHYASGSIFGGVTVLYRATVRNPTTEPRDPADPGEPPLKYATLTDVEILEMKESSGEGGDGGE